ncbi:MAG: hypothetical protein CM15mV33_820 [uncultured marine virus]|nr:MAG: hypothetical protein CM15mV33_820 [uncultured marine virus]
MLALLLSQGIGSVRIEPEFQQAYSSAVKFGWLNESVEGETSEPPVSWHFCRVTITSAVTPDFWESR